MLYMVVSGKLPPPPHLRVRACVRVFDLGSVCWVVQLALRASSVPAIAPCVPRAQVAGSRRTELGRALHVRSGSSPPEVLPCAHRAQPGPLRVLSANPTARHVCLASSLKQPASLCARRVSRLRSLDLDGRGGG